MLLARRNLLQFAGCSAASLIMNRKAFGQEDAPNPKSNKFLLYVHFGSACGMASGLIQPVAPNVWPRGFFQDGAPNGSNNPLLNQHTVAGQMFFHDYLKFLAPLAPEMCLVNGTPQSLDHGVAKNLQTRGNQLSTVSAEWAMAVGQFMKTDQRRNPMVVTEGVKAASVGDITQIRARSIQDFKTITSDTEALYKKNLDPFWEVLKGRFADVTPGTVTINSSLAGAAKYQINTLTKGLPELDSASSDIRALDALLNGASLNKMIAGCADRQEIEAARNETFRAQLILAGTLAKTGLASGMTVEPLYEDMHSGGSDVITARRASAAWAYIALFWQWVKSAGLQDDVLIVVGQEFARSPYNKDSMNLTVKDAAGANITVNAAGRDHGLSMGTMFIGSKVPSNGRIGMIGENMAPQATRDSKGTIDASGAPFTGVNIVGSMLMRSFDDLFPTERMVRKHWPDFVPIDLIAS
ncbi:MAG: DUF1501 domain-containing protein [Proteobacteria bacterium]|nr:MAG: DUF1501 domain-containing protein [Pseudomonadota bacterium]